MTLRFVVGFSKDLSTAKERAAFFFNKLEVRTRFEAVESQLGFNELEEPAWFTTIWYTELPDPVTQDKEAEKHEYIGSQGVDPNDPDWFEKLYGDLPVSEEIDANQVQVSDCLITADTLDVLHKVNTKTGS